MATFGRAAGRAQGPAEHALTTKPGGRPRRRPLWHPRTLLLIFRPQHPAQFVATTFAFAILSFTGLLMLPVAHEGGVGSGFREALFTATSAVCVTGLTVVDTPTHWSTFGEVVILLGFQIGGLGIMAWASLLGLLVSRRLGLRTRLLASTESKALGLGDVTRVVRGVVVVSLAIEAVVAVVLWLRLWIGYGETPGRAAYLGVFHSVSAFNNAGFALYSDSLMRYVSDPTIVLTVAAAVFVGSFGFPVLFELRRELGTPRTWSVHTKITVVGSVVLLVAGTLPFVVFEWTNARTLGPLSVPEKVLTGLFQGGVMPRSGGFNTVDVSAMQETTWLATDVLMFIGGGSGGTAGGIKLTTFFLLFFAIVAEARGEDTVDAFGRRIPPTVIRQALTVALLGVALVVSGTIALLAISGLDLDRVLFEVISAFATVGLSTGITPGLPPAGQYLLIALMFAGRTGTITLASALALHQRRRLYKLPEERPIVG